MPIGIPSTRAIINLFQLLSHQCSHLSGTIAILANIRTNGMERKIDMLFSPCAASCAKTGVLSTIISKIIEKISNAALIFFLDKELNVQVKIHKKAYLKDRFNCQK